jgi:hypothetical protein
LFSDALARVNNEGIAASYRLMLYIVITWTVMTTVPLLAIWGVLSPVPECLLMCITDTIAKPLFTATVAEEFAVMMGVRIIKGTAELERRASQAKGGDAEWEAKVRASSSMDATSVALFSFSSQKKRGSGTGSVSSGEPRLPCSSVSSSLTEVSPDDRSPESREKKQVDSPQYDITGTITPEAQASPPIVQSVALHNFRALARKYRVLCSHGVLQGQA